MSSIPGKAARFEVRSIQDPRTYEQELLGVFDTYEQSMQFVYALGIGPEMCEIIDQELRVRLTIRKVRANYKKLEDKPLPR